MSEQMDQIAVLVESLKECRAPQTDNESTSEDYEKEREIRDRRQAVLDNLSQAAADWRAKRKAEGAAEALERLAEQFNARAFHVQAPMESAFLEAERECRAEAATLRGSSQPEPVKVPEGITDDLLDLLNDISEFLKNYEDADGDTERGGYIPNKAIRLRMSVEEQIAALNAAGGMEK